jgi:hypothetical protein
MTIASFIFKRRREMALFGASVLLHLLALSWVVPQLGRTKGQDVASEPAPIVVSLLAEPEPVAEPRPPPARPPVRKRRAPAPKAAPVAPAAPPVSEPLVAEQSGAAETGADVQSVQPATAAPVEAAPAAVAEVVQVQPEPAAPVPAPARQYRVDLPPSARIVLDVERKDADGTLWHGEAAMAWRLKGDSYSMKVEAGISLLVARVNLVLIESEGKVGETGFAPVLMTEKRRGKAQTATHFSERDGRITFSASPATFALEPGTQDKATVPLQLAAIARGDSSQLGGNIEILVGEDKDASVFRFMVLGQEELDTGLGKMQAWHLSRPPRAGAYGSRLDIWLAPGHGWFPVQIRNIEASGAVTTQTANKIVITDSGS